MLESRALGFWFIVLTVVTAFGTLAAMADNLATTGVLLLLTAGSGLLAGRRLGAGGLGRAGVLHR